MSAKVVTIDKLINVTEDCDVDTNDRLLSQPESVDLVNGYIKNIMHVIIIPHCLIELCFEFFYIDIQDLIASKSYNELYQIASDLYDNANYTKAVCIIQHLLSNKNDIDNHKDALIQHIYALILDEYKDYKRSRIQYQRAIILEPRNNCIYANYGLSLQEQKEYKEAETQFLKALELVDDRYDRHSLAKLYEETKQFDRAEEQYKIICTHSEGLNPKYIQYYADYLKRNDKYCDAIIQYKYVIKMLEVENGSNNDNDLKLMYLRLGICYKRLNDFVNAEICLKKCLEIDENYLLAHDHCAHWFYCQKRYIESLAYYKRLIKLSPDDCDSYYWTALNLRELGRYKESEMYYKICLKMNPISKNVNGSYAHCLYLMDDMKGAIFFMGIAKKLDSDNEWTHYYNALLLKKLHKNNESQQAFLQCLKMNDKNHRCNYQYALHLIDGNKLQESLKYLQVAKEQEKDNQEYHEKYIEIAKRQCGSDNV